MKFETAIQNICLAEKSFSLYQPLETDVKAWYQNAVADGEHPAFPYWAKLWPSALALSEFIARHPQYVAGKQVLEIAAGLGLPSLVAAGVASQVQCTDLSAEAMEYAAASTVANGFQNMQCFALDWNHCNSRPIPDILLLSDVNYEPEVFDSLQKIILHFLDGGATILLASPQRLMAKAFIEKLLPFCTEQHCQNIQDPSGLHAISIYVLAIQQ